MCENSLQPAQHDLQAEIVAALDDDDDDLGVDQHHVPKRLHVQTHNGEVSCSQVMFKFGQGAHPHPAPLSLLLLVPHPLKLQLAPPAPSHFALSGQHWAIYYPAWSLLSGRKWTNVSIRCIFLNWFCFVRCSLETVKLVDNISWLHGEKWEWCETFAAISTTEWNYVRHLNGNVLSSALFLQHHWIKSCERNTFWQTLPPFEIIKWVKHLRLMTIDQPPQSKRHTPYKVRAMIIENTPNLFSSPDAKIGAVGPELQQSSVLGFSNSCLPVSSRCPQS